MERYVAQVTRVQRAVAAVAQDRGREWGLHGMNDGVKHMQAYIRACCRTCIHTHMHADAHAWTQTRVQACRSTCTRVQKDRQHERKEREKETKEQRQKQGQSERKKHRNNERTIERQKEIIALVPFHSTDLEPHASPGSSECERRNLAENEFLHPCIV